jgi:hypothetical protein
MRGVLSCAGGIDLLLLCPLPGLICRPLLRPALSRDRLLGFGPLPRRGCPRRICLQGSNVPGGGFPLYLRVGFPAHLACMAGGLPLRPGGVRFPALILITHGDCPLG